MPASVHPVLDESGSVLAEALGLNQDQRVLPTRPKRKDQAPPGSELASSSLPPPPPPEQKNHPVPPQHVPSAQEQQLSGKSPKKKRGRPAKAKVLIADSEPSTSAPKKKRGRPRKTAVQVSNPVTSSPQKKETRATEKEQYLIYLVFLLCVF